jgi:hypothetical protein
MGAERVKLGRKGAGPPQLLAECLGKDHNCVYHLLPHSCCKETRLNLTTGSGACQQLVREKRGQGSQEEVHTRLLQAPRGCTGCLTWQRRGSQCRTSVLMGLPQGSKLRQSQAMVDGRGHVLERLGTTAGWAGFPFP